MAINVGRQLHWVNTQIHQSLVKLKNKKVSLLSWPTSNIRRERRWPSSSTLSNSAPCSTGSPSLNNKQFKFVKVVLCETLCAFVSDVTLKINSKMKRIWKGICLWIWLFLNCFKWENVLKPILKKVTILIHTALWTSSSTALRARGSEQVSEIFLPLSSLPRPPGRTC